MRRFLLFAALHGVALGMDSDAERASSRPPLPNPFRIGGGVHDAEEAGTVGGVHDAEEAGTVGGVRDADEVGDVVADVVIAAYPTSRPSSPPSPSRHAVSHVTDANLTPEQHAEMEALPMRVHDNWRGNVGETLHTVADFVEVGWKRKLCPGLGNYMMISRGRS